MLKLLTCHFLLIMNFLSLSVLNITPIVLSCSDIIHLLCKHSDAVSRFLQRMHNYNTNCISYTLKENQVATYSFRFTNKEEIKSLASCEMASNASSSKSYEALVMFAKVSASFSPMNGDKPDNLKK